MIMIGTQEVKEEMHYKASNKYNVKLITINI